ncbi:hypothetical protein MNEG_13664 [Monoraphidium neglectum]|uniref:ABC transporter domain-containing protein n=1 Tax=Monoraphidium neglectum TaxID=145388 RepID=A0A0D2LRK7_9CHLO|nr:hypothetical protein MNEG_13664 [Monoraphidium neglectum]KIY94299.1 hypothetical protein MNEG_13664 [Monoraphidium neglectum]|eukprot:XP_013893319.1 hypothetical protein MNEG_13664 [Monoraphidium neglectum]
MRRADGEVKKSSSSKDKEKKEKKEGDEKHKHKDKDGGDHKEKKHKDKEGGDKKDKKEKAGASGSSSKKDKAGAAAAPAAPARRVPPQLIPKKGAPPPGDYLAGIDLPSSDSEEEEREEVQREEKGPLTMQVNAREAKKLADKERMLLEKAHRMREDAMREDDNVFDVSFEGMGNEDATVSATDIKVHNLTVRAKGKLLLENTALTITAGKGGGCAADRGDVGRGWRRYGLAGPNGRGKSTLLKLMARRQIPVPPDVDVLLVEQEVVGSEQSALQAVVAADVELVQLRLEEAQLTEELSADTHEPGFDADAASHRLNEVYEAMAERGAATAESRASKILHGLGFTPVMQRARGTRKRQ